MGISDVHDPEAAARFIKEFEAKLRTKVCMAPSGNCQGRIVSAHTLSVEAMLRPLARDGHVYSFKSNMFAPSEDRAFAIELKGIRQTSVFYGFCEHHDRTLFAPIETETFACTPQQLFMYAYRAVARETYLKRNMGKDALDAVRQYKMIHGLGSDVEVVPSPVLLDYVYSAYVGEREYAEIKAKLDGWLETNQWRRLITTVVPLGKTPPVVCSFAYAPDYDFEGNLLQDYSDYAVPLSHLFVTVIPAGAGGFALFSYLDIANRAPRRLIDSLVSQSDFTSSLIWLIFCNCENLAISPEWFEGQSELARASLDDVFLNSGTPFATKTNVLRECSVALDSLEPGAPFTM